MTADQLIAIVTPLAIIVAAVIQQMNANALTRKAEQLKAEAEELKRKLVADQAAKDAKLGAIAKTAESVHTLVNSKTGTLLNATAVALQRVADLTKKPADIEAANAAGEAYREHQQQQKIVDTAAHKPAEPVKESS